MNHTVKTEETRHEINKIRGANSWDNNTIYVQFRDDYDVYKVAKGEYDVMKVNIYSKEQKDFYLSRGCRLLDSDIHERAGKQYWVFAYDNVQGAFNEWCSGKR